MKIKVYEQKIFTGKIYKICLVSEEEKLVFGGEFSDKIGLADNEQIKSIMEDFKDFLKNTVKEINEAIESPDYEKITKESL